MQKENLDSEANLDQNQVYLSVHFTYNKGIREIGAAIISMNERLFQVAQFQDNEHFSNFESKYFIKLEMF